MVLVTLITAMVMAVGDTLIMDTAMVAGDTILGDTRIMDIITIMVVIMVEIAIVFVPQTHQYVQHLVLLTTPA